MQLNPYGEYAVLLAASLANDWPSDREGIEARTREFGMTMAFAPADALRARIEAEVPRWRRLIPDIGLKVDQ